MGSVGRRGSILKVGSVDEVDANNATKDPDQHQAKPGLEEKTRSSSVGSDISAVAVLGDEAKVEEKHYWRVLLKALIQPAMVSLFIAAAVRHTGK